MNTKRRHSPFPRLQFLVLNQYLIFNELPCFQSIGLKSWWDEREFVKSRANLAQIITCHLTRDLTNSLVQSRLEPYAFFQIVLWDMIDRLILEKVLHIYDINRTWKQNWKVMKLKYILFDILRWKSWNITKTINIGLKCIKWNDWIGNKIFHHIFHSFIIVKRF